MIGQPDDDPFDAALKQARGQGQQAPPPPDDPFDAALKAHRSQTPTPGHVPYTPKPEPTPPPSIASTIRGALFDALNLPPVVKGMAEDVTTHPLRTAINVGQGVPGGKAAQAGFAVMGSHLPGWTGLRPSPGPMTYADALSALDDETKDTPLLERIASKIPGAMVTGSALPALGPMTSWATAGKTALTGAGLSGTDRLLAGTDESLSDRLKGAATSAVIGGVAAPVISAGGDFLNTLAKRFQAPTIGTNMDARKLARSEASGPLYDKFRALGELQPTPKLNEALSTPIIQKAIATVKGESPEMMKMADTDARVLADAYELVGNKAWRAHNGYRLSGTREFFKQAIDDASGGNFAPAVNTFRDASQEMNAVTRGNMATKYAASPLGAPETKTDLSPSAFARWAPSATPDELQAATEGIGGRLKGSPILARVGFKHVGIPVPFPSPAMRAAPDLLEQTGAGLSSRVRNTALADLLASLTSR